MSELLLIRHGQATPFEDDTDRLSALGETQARAVGTFLAASGVVPSRVVHGPMPIDVGRADSGAQYV